jgi:hypothetical protein
MHHTDAETALCIKELGPGVERLMEQGIAREAIVRALAELSIRTIADASQAEKLRV